MPCSKLCVPLVKSGQKKYNPRGLAQDFAPWTPEHQRTLSQTYSPSHHLRRVTIEYCWIYSWEINKKHLQHLYPQPSEDSHLLVENITFLKKRKRLVHSRHSSMVSLCSFTCLGFSLVAVPLPAKKVPSHIIRDYNSVRASGRKRNLLWLNERSHLKTGYTVKMPRRQTPLLTPIWNSPGGFPEAEQQNDSSLPVTHFHSTSVLLHLPTDLTNMPSQ